MKDTSHRGIFPVTVIFSGYDTHSVNPPSYITTSGYPRYHFRIRKTAAADLPVPHEQMMVFSGVIPSAHRVERIAASGIKSVGLPVSSRQVAGRLTAPGI